MKDLKMVREYIIILVIAACISGKLSTCKIYWSLALFIIFRLTSTRIVTKECRFTKILTFLGSIKSS